MPIVRLLQNSSLPSDEVRRLATAYEHVLQALQLVDRNDRMAELVAEKIIQIGRSGVSDPVEIAALAVKQLQA
jgi:hypothetical protein